MARGYECLVQSLSDTTRARPGRQIAAIALERAISAIGGQLFLHSLLYTQAEAGLWARLHQLYAMAETAALEGVAGRTRYYRREPNRCMRPTCVCC